MSPFKPSPLMLYVHIPYCVHKCHYCDFNSHERATPDWDLYQHALIRELDHWLASAMFRDRPFSSIFFGGGTPSLAPPSLVASVIRRAEEAAGFDDNIEITLEANPGTVDICNFSAFRQAGVNRLSMGVQSLNDKELLWLERIHNAEEVLRAFSAARSAGFNNINLDLIYGLPDQSMSSWLTSLKQIIDLKPEHLSCYQLTVEPHTKLAARHKQHPYHLPDDELALEMLFTTRKHLDQAGYRAYEISNFAREGLHCRHNDGYWRYNDYIGIGAGASGKWDDPDTAGICRYSNIRNPDTYTTSTLQTGSAVNSQESLRRTEAAAEAVWLGLRRHAGIQREWFLDRFGLDPALYFAKQLTPWRQQKKLCVDEQSVWLTGEGLALADAISASVL